MDESSRADLAGVLVRERVRIREIAAVLRRYGLSGLADRVSRAGGETVGVKGRIAALADDELRGLTTGARMRLALTELGTTWIKLGQLLSLRPDLVGVDVATELEGLQTDVPPDAPGYAEGVIADALGRGTDELFAAFESEAFASGSVAQVHRATLPDGRDVVVKVLHDGVEQRVKSDLELMSALAAFLAAADPVFQRMGLVVLADEFDETMRAAIDLEKELGNLALFRGNFAEDPDIRIPEGFPELSESRVLTMMEMTGSTLADAASVRAAGWDVDALAHRTSEVYFQMMFRDGVFHADPHPGNFLLQPGQVIILDFGDVGRLTATRRRQLEDLVAAFASKDVDELTDAVVDLTAAPADTDLEVLRGDLDRMTSTYLGAGNLGSVDLGGLIGALAQAMHRSRLSMPSELGTVFRVLLLLQGLSRRIGATLDLNELAQPYVDERTRQRLDPQAALRRAGRRLREWDRVASTLPRDVADVLQQVREGRLSIGFDVADPGGRVDQLVDGMLVAALVIVSGELLARRTDPMVAGLSGPGLAVAGAGFFVYRRVVARRGESGTTISRVMQAVSRLTGRSPL